MTASAKMETTEVTHDLSLGSGERQVAERYEDIRADHRFRYEWADKLVGPGGFGLDAFCGNGYGAWLLGKKRIVLGLDGSKEAIAFASDYYGGPKVRFTQAYWPFELPQDTFDFIVSLESIEHVPDGPSFFASLSSALKPGGVLVYSTPNEDILPLASTGNHFHHRHYTTKEARNLAFTEGMDIIAMAGQNTYSLTPEGKQSILLAEADMALQDGVPGQFNIYACQKKSVKLKARRIRDALLKVMRR